MRPKLVRWAIWILALSAILGGATIFSLSIGSSGLFFKRILPLLFEGRGSTEYSILFDIRLPRILLGLAIGGSLSLAGVILQGMFRNPLVEPYTLGISGGAALGVSLCVVFKLSYIFGIISLPISGIVGSIFIIILIYLLSIRKGMLRIHGLLLTGVMISFVASSLIMLVMAISRSEDLHGIVFWMMGSLEEPNWLYIKMALVISLAGLVISYPFSLSLNALSLGEEEAHGLGINTERTKRFLFLLSCTLTGFSVSVSGIIGFVGLVVPHIVRLFVGSDHRILLVSSYIAGAIFLILCDALARTIIAPLELPVGVITGILGASLFLYAFIKRGATIVGGK
ncbi:MAG: iron ABC transporter permease [Candidatus Omnitrophica bacterium]|nr:iron ABC transporter permease [Candidatus Omnitrophota bacterium]